MTSRIISSRDNALYRELKRLAVNVRTQGSGRLALLDGIHLIQACLAAQIAIRYLVITPEAKRNREVEVLERSVDASCVIVISEMLFKDLTSLVNPVGIAAVIEIPRELDWNMILDTDALVLDAIQDAGNVGTMLRTAACAGVKNVVLGKGCAGAWTIKVLRAAQGAHFSLQIAEQIDLPQWLVRQTLPAVGADCAATSSLFQQNLRGSRLWIFGNEGQGLSGVVKDRLTQLISIPMASSMESLNVSAAAAVCLYEAYRQRNSD